VAPAEQDSRGQTTLARDADHLNVKVHVTQREVRDVAQPGAGVKKHAQQRGVADPLAFCACARRAGHAACRRSRWAPARPLRSAVLCMPWGGVSSPLMQKRKSCCSALKRISLVDADPLFDRPTDPVIWVTDSAEAYQSTQGGVARSLADGLVNRQGSHMEPASTALQDTVIR
jgi:hypothetical protein